MRISTAIQNVYHCTLFRRSCHHCGKAFGSDSYALMMVRKRSFQYRYWSSERLPGSSSISPARGSSLGYLFRAFRNHRLHFALERGSKSASVCKVSVTSSLSYTALACELANTWYSHYQQPHTCRTRSPEVSILPDIKNGMHLPVA